MPTNLRILADIPMFSLLDQGKRATLAGLVKEKRLDGEESVYTVGDYGDSLYIVRRGRVQLFVQDEAGESIVW